MSHALASLEWVSALKIAINDSASYRDAARHWEGDFHFVIEPDDAHNGLAPAVIYCDLWHGECRDALLVPGEHVYTPEFRIWGPRRHWVKVLRKEIDPIKALITNTLRLKGNLAKVMRNVKAAQELINAVATVDTNFHA